MSKERRYLMDDDVEMYDDGKIRISVETYIDSTDNKKYALVKMGDSWGHKVANELGLLSRQMVRNIISGLELFLENTKD